MWRLQESWIKYPAVICGAGVAHEPCDRRSRWPDCLSRDEGRHTGGKYNTPYDRIDMHSILVGQDTRLDRDKWWRLIF